jgi:hypothetical protein
VLIILVITWPLLFAVFFGHVMPSGCSSQWWNRLKFDSRLISIVEVLDIRISNFDLTEAIYLKKGKILRNVA